MSHLCVSVSCYTFSENMEAMENKLWNDANIRRVSCTMCRRDKTSFHSLHSFCIDEPSNTFDHYASSLRLATKAHVTRVAFPEHRLIRALVRLFGKIWSLTYIWDAWCTVEHHLRPQCWGTGLPHGLYIRRTGHNPPRGPSAGWWVLTTANATA
jgi:hypothetical protein